VVSITRYGDAMAAMKGKVLTGIFELAGERFMAIDGGPQFPFTEAISLLVECETQEEVDMLWEKLTASGQEGQCGWLKDKYGLSWQVVPSILGKLIGDHDAEKSNRVMKAMLAMKKIDGKKLQEAYDG
jgi:predicted 3-demethylubiquinone-9 3-methyltransferase (glyoxalase superfamily)